MFKYIKNIILTCIKLFYKTQIKKKVYDIRHKSEISVLFVVSDLSKWKSKALYDAMASHDRFKPQVGVTMRIGETASENARKSTILLNYLISNKIHYIELKGNNQDPNFDIIIYQEPYIGSVPIYNSVYGNLSSLFISIHYGFHTTTLPVWYTQPFHNYCWFDCFENQILFEQIQRLYKHRKNIVVTGLPMTDELLYKNSYNPWKDNNKRKKRIIWAPHHSIGAPNESITYSTFLTIAEELKTLAIKYTDQVQWAFKPHPWLRSKVEKIWGKEKTDNYYKFWETFNSSQAEYGEYVSLFQHSDAMIHDSSSFIIEYLYMLKPVLFINNGQDNKNELNTYAREAINLHYQANSIKDIESFILSVINNQDPLYDDRLEFYERILLPPNNNTSSQNIIDYILGDS